MPPKPTLRDQVLSLTEHITVPYGAYQQVLKTKDFSPLEPAIVENKYYARGVGFIRETTVKGGKETSDLVSIDRP